MGTPDYTLRFRVYEVDPDDGPRIGALLGELTDWTSAKFRVEYNGLGAGEFVINRHSPQAEWLAIDGSAPKRYVKCYIDDFDSPPVFGFFLQSAEVVAASRAEQGGETVRIGGPGALAILRTAILHHTTYTGNDSGLPSGTTGMWHWTDVAIGGPLIRQIEEALARGAFPDVSVDFTRTHDSSGAAWDMTFDFQAPIGQNLWEMTAELQKAGLIVGIDYDDFTVHAYKEYGEDRSATVLMEYADNIQDASSKQINAEGGASWALVRGKRASGVPVFKIVEEVDERGIGHVEGYGGEFNTASNSPLTRVARRFIEQSMNEYDGTATITLVEEAGDPRALIDYLPGDTVFLDVPGVFDDQLPQVVAITLEATAGGEYDPTVELARIEQGGFGGGGGGEPPTEPWHPCPPAPPAEGTEPLLIYEEQGTGSNAGNRLIDPPPAADHTLVWYLWQFGGTGTPVSGNGWTLAGFAHADESGDGHVPGIAAIYYRHTVEGETGIYTTLAGSNPPGSWSGVGHIQEWDQLLVPADTAVADNQPGSTNLDAGAADATPGAGALLAGAYLQYNGLVVDSTTPDAGLTEICDRSSNSFSGGTDFRWAWGAYQALSDGSSGLTVGGTSSVAGVWCGIVVAFEGTAAPDDDDDTCPPPVPGQPVAPLELAVDSCDQVDYQIGTPDGTPIPYQLDTLRVSVRRGAQLVPVLYIPTDPATGKFRLLESPCEVLPSTTVFMTGYDAAAAEWKLLFSTEGEPLLGIVPGTTGGLPTLIVEFVAGSGTGAPPGPPTPPEAPPATAPSLVTDWYSGSPGTGSDQSAAIAAFLGTAAPGKVLGIHPGTYRTDELFVTNVDDLALVATGVVFKRVDPSALGSPIFTVWTAHRLAIYDLTVEGTATSGDVAAVGPTFPREDEHAIALVDVHGFTLSGVWGRKVFGDGLYYARIGAGAASTLCEDGLVTTSLFSTCGRNGVSHISGRRIRLHDVRTSDCSLHGFDVEGNAADDVCEDLTIEGDTSFMTFGRGAHGLDGYAFQLTPGYAGVVCRRVLVAGATMDVGQIKVTGPSSGTKAEQITVRDCTASSAGTSVIAHVSDWVQTNNEGLTLPASGTVA